MLSYLCLHGQVFSAAMPWSWWPCLTYWWIPFWGSVLSRYMRVAAERYSSTSLHLGESSAISGSSLFLERYTSSCLISEATLQIACWWLFSIWNLPMFTSSCQEPEGSSLSWPVEQTCWWTLEWSLREGTWPCTTSLEDPAPGFLGIQRCLCQLVHRSEAAKLKHLYSSCWIVWDAIVV